MPSESLQGKTPFGADDIESIVVHGSQVTVEHVGWPYQPQGLVSAQLNLPFCVATLLLEGDVFVDQFTEEAVNDKRRIELSKKVSVVHDPSITGARLELPAHGAGRGASEKRRKA